MSAFPTVRTREEYAAALDRREAWLPGVREICRRHGLPTDDLRPLPIGSNVVFAAGTRVVKAFAPFWPREAAAERARRCPSSPDASACRRPRSRPRASSTAGRTS